MIAQQSRFAVSPVDASPLYYSVAEPTGHPQVAAKGTVLLSDGIGCDGYAWRYIHPALLQEYRVVHWNYPGHGRTPAPKSRTHMTIECLARDLLAVLDDCDIPLATLSGHSMGVQVSLECYRLAPERVSGLIFICGAPGNPLQKFRGSSRMAKSVPLVSRVVNKFPSAFNSLSKTLLPTRLAFEIATMVEADGALVEPADFMPYLKGMSRVDLRLFLDLLESATNHSAADVLTALTVPTLIIAGQRDSFTPPEISIDMHNSAPESEFIMIERGSHTAPLECPRQVNEAILDFLRRRLDTPPA